MTRYLAHKQQVSLLRSAKEVDRNVATFFGERQRRTVSSVIGQSISNATGLSLGAAVDVGHAMMVAAAASPKARPYLLGFLTFAFVAGVVCPTSAQSQVRVRRQ